MSNTTKQYIEDAIRYYKKQRYQEALEAFEQAIQIDPVSVKALHGKGVILTEMKEYKKAIESYEQASKLAPDIAKIHLDMAEVCYMLKDYEKSGLSFRKAIQLDRTYELVYWDKTQALVSNGIRLHELGSRDEAISAFQQVLLFNPADTQAASHLSRLQKKKRKPTAPNSSKTQLEQKPRSAYSHPFNCRCPECCEPPTVF